MTTTLDPNVFFNCCPNQAEPDWSQFDCLEIGGCIVETLDDGSTETHGGYDADEANMFCVYGHYREGSTVGEGIEDLTDCATFEDAEEVAEILSLHTGLEIRVTC